MVKVYGESNTTNRFFAWYRERFVMMRFVAGIFALLVLLAAGGFIFLASWDMPRPAREVEKVIPNERFFTKADQRPANPLSP